MRAVVVTELGGPEVLELRKEPAPEAGPGQLVVDVAVGGVNYRDVYERTGVYPTKPPVIAGVEGAGTVAAVAEDVTEFSPGDRVAWKNAQGSYAEQVVVPAGEAVPIPEGISDELACAVLLQGLTAHYLAHSTYPVQPGDEVLVHAGAGGVGSLLTQIVKMLGGRVTATTSGGEKVELARAAGADEVIGYDEVPEGTFAVVYDGVGKDTFDRSLAALRPRGMMALYGAASGPVPSVELSQLNAKSLFITRPTLAHYASDRAELLRRAHDLFGWLVDGKLDVRIGGRYPLEEARQAQEDLAARRTTGKLLLTIDEKGERSTRPDSNSARLPPAAGE
jgi:NADPH:quinone reductase